ncbi:M3 family metallopeptidase [Pseudonocardia asaccharolytica]|uniref:Peptidyl-dipeptidase Dcp n=1 Tax=Pseudonocardia asaccharolytica DSM 44247 = NBRC 16224 TaxID=1123024 RepID=A0A511CWA4_9PSEU|nr:M3 family metallopeptidase [Pseudonocardia asaccharolytica]GEL16523.1 peptidyl-dipeptidase Dcp [Pseudonocardia asaccharolytica DSM 44247 = NBRC 16224]
MTVADNPFLAPSPLPYQLPDYRRIIDEHYLPAFEHGMAQQRAEVEDIAANPQPPTFENTIVALERSGQVLTRVSAVFFGRASAHTNSAIEQLQAEIAPRLAAHRDAIELDPRLVARIRDLHDRRDALDLDPESLRLLERYHLDAVRAGAELGEADQQRLRALNAELSTLSTVFGTRLLAEMNDSAVAVDDPARLDGLPPDAIAGLASAATARGRDGYLLTLVLPTGQPALASLTDRELRARLFDASASRGARGNDNDTRELVLRLVALRAERARLLGFANHAEYVIADSTAGSVENVTALLAGLVPAAVANAETEAVELQAAVDATGSGHEFAPWDWGYYAEQVRRERYDLDVTTLRPYLELDRVLHDGVFHAAGWLYGLRFVERRDLPMYHEDVRVWEVFDAEGPLGLFGADLYARETKRGGAWMNALVAQAHLLGTRPVVMNTLNIAKPPAGEPTLLTFDEVRTLFHEFGHALHGLLSDVRHPRFSGTNVPRDFVEYPSQVNEMWSVWPEVLANYARHHQTGEPMPPELVERLLGARRYGQGFATLEYLAAALLDLAWHSLGADDEFDGDDVVQRFEAEALAKAGVALSVVPPRYRSTYFNHIFAGAYSAAYYSYIWSEVLDADTVEWFRENGGLRRELGDAFRRALLAKGGSVDGMEAYRAFRGRDPEIAPLLARRGLS